jgi:DNA polymerase
MTDPEGKTQYEYPSRKGPVKMYGGKLVENICQAVARCVIAEQMLLIAKRYKVVLTVHDAVACIAPEAEAKEAQAYVETCMRWRPTWASALPLNCESGMGNSYGEC